MNSARNFQNLSQPSNNGEGLFEKFNVYKVSINVSLRIVGGGVDINGVGSYGDCCERGQWNGGDIEKGSGFCKSVCCLIIVLRFLTSKVIS